MALVSPLYSLLSPCIRCAHFESTCSRSVQGAQTRGRREDEVCRALKLPALADKIAAAIQWRFPPIRSPQTHDPCSWRAPA